MLRDTAAKVQTVLSKNTFFFADPRVQERQEHYISSLVQSILLLKSKIEEEGLKRSLFVEFLVGNPLGLDALLAIVGVSNETLNRLLELVRQVNDPQLNKLANVSSWPSKTISGQRAASAFEGKPGRGSRAGESLIRGSYCAHFAKHPPSI